MQFAGAVLQETHPQPVGSITQVCFEEDGSPPTGETRSNEFRPYSVQLTTRNAQTQRVRSSVLAMSGGVQLEAADRHGQARVAIRPVAQLTCDVVAPAPDGVAATHCARVAISDTDRVGVGHAGH